MGYNATVVVMNDALGDIENDPNFGKNLVAAILQVSNRNGKIVDVVAGSHGNAAHVVETHHADQTAIITVGGNLGVKQFMQFGWDHHTEEGQRKLVKAWAEQLGMKVTMPKKTVKPA